MLFCDNQFEQGCGTATCSGYAHATTPPCSEQGRDGDSCWVPYVLLENGTCMPFRCSVYGMYTDFGRYENGGSGASFGILLHWNSAKLGPTELNFG